MIVTIERLEDYFDEDIIEEMLEPIDKEGCCHYNAAMVCHNFKDWGCIDYAEGYIYGKIGHAINQYTDYEGNKHYFDVTQECYYKKGDITKFLTEFNLVKTFSADEIFDIFEKDKYTHLVSVEVLNSIN